MSRLALALSLSLALVTTAQAKEKEGIKLPDTITAEGKELKLNGMGLRTRFFVKVYVAGLYTETPAKGAQQVLAADEVKRISLVLMRDMDKKQMSDGLRDAFNNNVTGKPEAYKERLDKFAAMFPNLKNGQSIHFTYVPAKGLVVSSTAGEHGVIEGKDFADAFLGIWLGKQPVDDGMKKNLLGQE